MKSESFGFKLKRKKIVAQLSIVINKQKSKIKEREHEEKKQDGTLLINFSISIDASQLMHLNFISYLLSSHIAIPKKLKNKTNTNP